MGHYQRDITEPLVYDEHYDIVLAFSVSVYIRPVLQRIAEITDQLLVLETHKLEDNLDSYYLKPTLQYFPYYEILGESEWLLMTSPMGSAQLLHSQKRNPCCGVSTKGVLSAAK